MCKYTVEYTYVAKDSNKTQTFPGNEQARQPQSKFLKGQTHILWANQLTHKKLLSQIILILHPEYFPVVVITALFYPLITANKSRLAAGLRGVSPVSSGQTKYAKINYVIKHLAKTPRVNSEPLAINLMTAGIYLLRCLKESFQERKVCRGFIRNNENHES